MESNSMSELHTDINLEPIEIDLISTDLNIFIQKVNCMLKELSILNNPMILEIYNS